MKAAKWILVILALLVGAIAGFVVHGLLTPDGIKTGADAPAPADYDVALTADFALSVLSEKIPQEKGLSVTALQFHAPCTLAVAGQVDTAKLTGKVSGFTALLAKLLPETLDLTATAALRTENGRIKAEITSISFEKLTVGGKIIPTSLNDYISETVSKAAESMAENIGELAGISASENTLFVSLK